MGDHCSPLSKLKKKKEKDNDLNSTCFSKTDLLEIIKAIKPNAEYANHYKILKEKNKSELISIIKDHFKETCSNERCWVNYLKDANLSSRLIKMFKPIRPSSWKFNPTTWLNTNDITNVLQQFEDVYPFFNYLGTVPADFEEYTKEGSCVAFSLCTFNIKEQPSDKTCFALVINLDTHDLPGSHWVSIFINKNPKRKNYGIYYYDSNGIQPSGKIKKFIDRIHAEMQDEKGGIGNKRVKQFEKKYNKIRKQFTNGECGVFAMTHIIHHLERNMTFDEICMSMPTDKIIHGLRYILYADN